MQIATIAAMSGEMSATARLMAEAAVVDRLTAVVAAFLAHWIRGDYDRTTPPAAARRAHTRLITLQQDSAALSSPVLPVSLGVQLRRYADPRVAPDLPPTFNSADLARAVITNLVPRLLQPFGAFMSIAAFTGTLRKQIDQLDARPDWTLIADPPHDQLAALAALMGELHDVLAEVGASEDEQPSLGRLRQTATSPTPLAAAAAAAQQAATERTTIMASRLHQALAEIVDSLPVRTQVVTRASDDRYGVAWPPQDFAVVARSDSLSAIIQLIPAAQRARGSVLPLAASLTLLGVLGDQLAAPLTYQVHEQRLLPRLDHVDGWQVHVGLPLLAAPTYTAAIEAESALVTLSALNLLRERRSLCPTEQEFADRAAAQLQDALRHLANTANAATEPPPANEETSGPISLTETAFSTLPGQAFAVIYDWYRGVQAEVRAVEGEFGATVPAGPAATNPGSFAQRVTASARGEDEELTNTMTILHLVLLAHDVDPNQAQELMVEWTRQGS
ncbi:hypothetical protein EV192_10482 [Actinocrispum wychmicini]|uniref:Uncharacterized protein n=1 Tax=Actinocrispum wychmicini TaxID=1213861 RepID=A0A4R2JHC9_9PSEU|nr:hypothetical protein EV192_10482 [Actinocrispum wychmicini]